MEDRARRNEPMPAEQMRALTPESATAVARLLSSNLDAEWERFCADRGL